MEDTKREEKLRRFDSKSTKTSMRAFIDEETSTLFNNNIENQ